MDSSRSRSTPLELGFDVGRDVAKVSGNGHANAFGLEDESNWVGGIVGNGERADGDVADLNRLSGLEVLDRRAARWDPFREAVLRDDAGSAFSTAS